MRRWDASAKVAVLMGLAMVDSALLLAWIVPAH